MVLAPTSGRAASVASLQMSPASLRRQEGADVVAVNYAARANSSLAFVFFPVD